MMDKNKLSEIYKKLEELGLYKKNSGDICSWKVGTKTALTFWLNKDNLECTYIPFELGPDIQKPIVYSSDIIDIKSEEQLYEIAELQKTKYNTYSLFYKNKREEKRKKDLEQDFIND